MASKKKPTELKFVELPLPVDSRCQILSIAVEFRRIRQVKIDKFRE